MFRRKLTIPLLAAALIGMSGSLFLQGCGGRYIVGGTAVGGAYEYQNKRALDQLEKDRAAGDISQDEYERRKKEIERRSIVY